MTTHFKIYKQTITVLEKIFCLNKKGEKKKWGLWMEYLQSILLYIIYQFIQLY